MGFIVDLIILAIILLFTFLGYKRGLIKVAIKLCTFFIAIIIAFILYKPVSNVVVENTGIDESIENTIISRILPEGLSVNDEIDMQNNLPNFILKNSENTVASIATSFSNMLIETSCLLIIFIATKIILKFITALADLIAKLPILKQFNKLGGTIYGVLEGLFFVFIGFTAISLFAPLLDTSLLDNINSSTLGSILYNNNILMKIIM